ncbi:asparagine synthase family protein [Cryptosporidium muris RN66]|uniref:Asparagine synthase family protein n=1 Tax=Cryptosporidium muris (strain RN66) TaxID=441375 RepID=B6A9A9_CRYMR|nr:asparagine synthase family protein [Cryptosporidium muris RN66]EEA04800.1 asparagine synthase family protein [Cryptosporidium muris RN66]|eukprot:XP_002139149.1 asparagine synthase family protein [Cryptosporidium muris RN66]
MFELEFKAKYQVNFNIIDVCELIQDFEYIPNVSKDICILNKSTSNTLEFEKTENGDILYNIRNNDTSDLFLVYSEANYCYFKYLMTGFCKIEKYRIILENINLNSQESLYNTVSNIMNIFCEIEKNSGIGFSFAGYYKKNEMDEYLIFGRDRIGTSSLLITRMCKGGLILSTAINENIFLSKEYKPIELPPMGFYILNLKNLEFEIIGWKEVLPYYTNSYWNINLNNMKDSTREDFGICKDANLLLNELRKNMILKLGDLISYSFNKEGIYGYIGIMFSGGLDSTLITYLVLETLFYEINNYEKLCKDKLLNMNKGINLDEFKIYFIIELLNSTFSPEEAPDRLTGLCSYYELKSIFQESFLKHNNVELRFICIDTNKDTLFQEENIILGQIYPSNTHMDFNIGSVEYFTTKGIGRLIKPIFYMEEWWNEIINNQNDQTLWCNIYDINLLKDNSYENTEKDYNIDNKSHKIKCPYCYFRQHPKCFNKCCKSCCRKIQQGLLIVDNCSSSCRVHKMKTTNFKGIPATSRNINTKNYYLESNLYHLSILPGESINCIYKSGDSSLYKSQSKWILIGSGADEFLGGYGRHITAKKHCGIQGIRDEMIMDIRRLWIRNLGRDDRICKYQSKGAFYPFLQINVIEVIGKLNFCNISGLKNGPTKPILRYISNLLGLRFATKFKKRAIQFGTRSTRQTNLEHFDSNRKATATAIYCKSRVKDLEI